MIESIVSILNAKIETTGRVDKRYCLSEKRTTSGGNEVAVPYAYQGNGEFKAVDYGKPSLSWWRLTGQASFLEAPTTSSVNKLQATYPLRLVVMFRRKESTKDDGYSPSWLAEDLSNLLTFSNGDLKTLLQASDVRVSVTGTDFNTTSVWNEEFDNLEFTDPKYQTALIALELNVVVTALKSCWENECDYDSDILHLFNFCKQANVDRLTPDQVTCLTTALCGASDPATLLVNGAPFTTVPSGDTLDIEVHDTADNNVGSVVSTTEIEIADSTNEVNGVDISDPTLAEGTHNQQIHDSLGSDVGTAANPSVIANATTQVNGVNVGSVVAEGTYDQAVHDSAGADVGTAANPSVVSDATVTINGASLGATGSVVAEGSVDLVVNLDGSPSGSWDGDSWEVTSSGGTAPSLAVAVSDSSPQWGDTITITATPSDITPTNYMAYNRCALNSLQFIGDQAGAVFNWQVEVATLGGNDIYVQANDGTDSCFNIGGETITVLGLLLDVYTGADRAYSTRLIRHDYTGALVLLRRSSDNAQLAFYPDSNNELSMTSEDGAGTDLSTWIGANTATLVTWYDQSSNATDVTQSIAAAQPVVVNAGSLVTVGGKAAIDFDGTADYMNTSTLVAYSGGVSWYCVIEHDSVAVNRRIWGDDNTGAQGYSVFFADGSYQINDNSTGFKAIAQSGITATQQILSSNIDDTNGNYNNGVDGSLSSGSYTSWTGPINSGATPNFGLMGAGNGAQYGDGKVQELVIYPNDQSANRTGIETDQNSHFTVY